MGRKHGPWTINQREHKYHHKLVDVWEDQVLRPDGSPGNYAVLKIKTGASVLALDDEGFVHLAKEFRYAIGKESIEVVSGAIDEGETPLTAAKRELKEELGIEAEEWIELGHVDPITSMVDSPSYLFLARGLTFGKHQQEGSENIKKLRVTIEQAVRMVMENEITHGSSCVAILKTNYFLNK